MRFYIVNDCDRPDHRHVAQVVNDKDQLEYIHPDLWDWCKSERRKLSFVTHSPTLEDFGFDIKLENGKATFKKVRDSVAKYANGKHRRWQGIDEFTLATKPMSRAT